ncbi:uncharacterized protein LOC108041307 [Drosophila rhopaloa]|uniref:Uncharacterized protein LOC108041307 n=1 Tax=Drosophila rhopaloa TaxID=1041015 RepID=A0A6P4EDU3_DRORH|nr:uncharacterized protein LOC108041307 [Drosophila rhopaloa]
MVVLKLPYLVILNVDCGFEFTNFKCTSLDKQFMDVEACFLKSKNRTYKYLTFKTKFYQLPIQDIEARVEVLKKLNGYKPFLFNFTIDACKFLKGKRNPIVRYFYELFASFSNMNHSCPYNHDIYVEKVPISYLNHQVTVVLPVPEGDYCLHAVYTIRSQPRLEIDIFFRIY